MKCTVTFEVNVNYPEEINEFVHAFEILIYQLSIVSLVILMWHADIWLYIYI